MKNKNVFVAGGIMIAATAASLVIVNKIKTSQLSLEKLSENAAKALNPISSDPGASLETTAFLNSMTPSLMTRSSINQGAVAAISVLSAKGISAINQKITFELLGKDKSYANRLLTRSVIGAGGYALSRVPEKDDESLLVSTLRSVGRLLEASSLSGAIYESMDKLKAKRASKNVILPLSIGAMLTGGILYRGKGLLEERRNLIDTVPEDPSNKIIPSFVATIGVLQVSRFVGYLSNTTYKGIKSWLGEGPMKTNTTKVTNSILWSGIAIGSYFALVKKIGKANELMENGYKTAPTDDNLSGSKNSVNSFEELGLQGRRYVTDVITEKQILQVTGKKAKKSPIRAYIGYNSEQKYYSARAEMAIAELKRTKAFDRKYLLLVSPTGTGWTDQTMIESAELLTSGDIATCVVQYSKYPSFLSVQKVIDGRRQFRNLLWSVNVHLSQIPKNKRPKVFVFGESLGAWSSSDTVMHTGIDGFDHYGIDNALWVGMPGLAKWGKIEHGETNLEIPKGTVSVFDRREQYEKLSTLQKKKLRAVILNHDNDPIAQLRPKTLVKRPKWLTGEDRGRGVPNLMEWTPILTFLQIAIDAANAMRVIPGQFRSHGHDYRADMAYFVNAAYGFGANTKNIDDINEYLELLELKRFNQSREQAGDVL